ncbi:restriction endonuclease subunit S [Nocardia gipuzkoensis]
MELLIDNRGKNPPFEKSGVPAISGMSVKPGRIDFSEARSVSEETWKKWMPEPTRRDDLILTSEAPLGRVAPLRDDSPVLIAQRVYCLRGQRGVLDSKFLYYAFQTDAVQADLSGRASGTTVLGIRQPELRKVVIPAPDYNEQRAIAEVLGALDDKIAANRHILRVADELNAAEVLSACAGGRSVQIKDLMTLTYGKALPATSRVPGDVKVYGSGGINGTHNVALVNRPGVIIGRKGTIGSIHWADGPHFPIDTTYYVDPTIPGSDPILYYLLRSAGLAELNSDSAVPGLNREVAYSHQIAFMADSTVGNLAAQLQTRFDWMSAVRRENETFDRTRDELLPLLMSGRLRVKDAENKVEAIA